MAWKQRFQITIAATLIGITIFTLTNPYLPFNILFHRQVLHSNVGNYGTFYQPKLSPDSLMVIWRSLVEGMSVTLLVIGLAGTCIAISIARKKTITLLPAAVALPVLIQFVLLAEGKTAEYARFGLTLDVILAIAAAWLIDILPITSREKSLAAVLLVAGTAFFGLRYDINFVLDNRPDSTRMEAAIKLEKGTAPVVAVWAEPAPYCLPPVNLFDRQIVLEPRGNDAFSLMPGMVGVRAVDNSKIIDPLAPPRVVSPISWANKPFEILNSSPVSTLPSRP